MGRKGLEKFFPALVMLPVDANDGATTGKYMEFGSLYKRCTILLLMADGSAGSDIDIKIYQDDTGDGTNAKVLNALETGRIYRMVGADLATYLALDGFSKITQATADEAYAPDDSGENVGIIALELQDTDLDVDNDFNYIRADLTDPGAAKIVACIYLFHDPVYSAAPENMKNPATGN